MAVSVVIGLFYSYYSTIVLTAYHFASNWFMLLSWYLTWPANNVYALEQRGRWKDILFEDDMSFMQFICKHRATLEKRGQHHNIVHSQRCYEPKCCVAEHSVSKSSSDLACFADPRIKFYVQSSVVRDSTIVLPSYLNCSTLASVVPSITNNDGRIYICVLCWLVEYLGLAETDWIADKSGEAIQLQV